MANESWKPEDYFGDITVIVKGTKIDISKMTEDISSWAKREFPNSSTSIMEVPGVIDPGFLEFQVRISQP